MTILQRILGIGRSVIAAFIRFEIWAVYMQDLAFTVFIAFKLINALFIL
jgi:hypothetical protein